MQKFLSKVIFFCFTLINSLYGLTTSVIVPCYPGHVKYLPELIEHYNNQTVLPDEMVISLSEIHKISKEDAVRIMECDPKFFINIVFSEEVLYAGQNRNSAAEKATGDILICQDADDIPHPQRIEFIKKSFEQKKIDILLHRWVPSDKDKILNNIYNFKRMHIYITKDWGKHECFDYIHYGNISIKKEVFNKVKWSDLKNSEDVKFARDCITNGFTLGIIDAYLLLYRNEFSSGT